MSASLLPFVQVQITRFGMTTVLILGNIGNGFIVLLFSKNRKNACALYLLSAAVMNIVYLTFNLTLSIYTSYYGDPTSLSLVFCKLRNYLSHEWGQMARYFIVLACIDRFLLTSASVRLRGLSRPSIAWSLMAIITILWHVLGIHIPIMAKIENGRCFVFDIYFLVYTVYVLIVISTIPPVMMAFFGISAYRNIRQVHARVRPAGNAAIRDHGGVTIHRRDRDLLRMLLAEVIVNIVLAYLYPFILLETTVTNYTTPSKSLERIQIENFISFIGSFLGYTSSGAAFYVYLVASKAFRNEFKQLVSNSWRRPTQQPVVSVNGQIQRQTGRAPIQETGV